MFKALGAEVAAVGFSLDLERLLNGHAPRPASAAAGAAAGKEAP
jgi:hypothetical protein